MALEDLRALLGSDAEDHDEFRRIRKRDVRTQRAEFTGATAIMSLIMSVRRSSGLTSISFVNQGGAFLYNLVPTHVATVLPTSRGRGC